MTPNLLRGTLYGVGASLWAWALAAAFITPWYWLLLIAGAVLIMAGGCVPRVGELDERHHDTDADGNEFEQITQRLAEFRPVWPNDAGSPE